LVIRIPNLEIFLFCQHNSTGGGNLELRQTIGMKLSHISGVHFESVCIVKAQTTQKVRLDLNS
jgi:hypothetical protein